MVDEGKIVMKLMCTLLLLLLPIEAMSEIYQIDYQKSELKFSGTHAGNSFEGIFEDWDVIIDFDRENLAASSFTARFRTQSAKTGDILFDRTLPEDDWFFVKEYPEALFESSSISKNKDGSFRVSGDLVIRAISKPAVFNFVLDDENPTEITAKASLMVNRLDYEIGLKSDPQAEWVSRDIKIEIQIYAQPE